MPAEDAMITGTLSLNATPSVISNKNLVDWSSNAHKSALKSLIKDLKKDDSSYPFLEPV